MTRLHEALVACESPRRRLLAVAETRRRTAEARCHELGLVAGSRAIDRDWRAPRELHREGPRLPVNRLPGLRSPVRGLRGDAR